MLEHEQSWNRADAILLRQGWLLVDIHFADRRTSGELGRELVNDRCHHVARSTPRRPEIHQHRLWVLQHLMAEVSLGKRCMCCVCSRHITLLYREIAICLNPGRQKIASEAYIVQARGHRRPDALESWP